jgi:hypothetical protein
MTDEERDLTERLNEALRPFAPNDDDRLAAMAIVVGGPLTAEERAIVLAPPEVGHA